MNEVIVEMRKIIKTFPGTKALDGVDLKLRKGEIHALVGENGAGKSTLMNVLSGQIMQDSGDITMEGRKVDFKSPMEAMKNNIVLVPQELNLIPEASIAENIFLGNEIHKGLWIDWDEERKKADEILKLLDIDVDIFQPVKQLSAAYKQIVSIARALTYQPKVLILDEPTSVLTDNEAKNLFYSMQRLKKEGTAIVFISHHLDEIMEQCDRITIMKDGKLVREVSVQEITKEEMINEMAGKEIKSGEHVMRKYSDEVFFEAKNLTRKGEFEDINFKVHKGEILCVAGLVGAGRTEIFKCIFGITSKDEGKTFVEGKEVNINSPIEAIKLGMGYVSEERRTDGITPMMSVKENMMLPSYQELSNKGIIDYGRVEKTTQEYIDLFRIKTASKETMIKNLSGGNQQKVIVARWMAKGVKMLILDEPTRGIDVNAKGEIHNLIRQLADDGVAVVVISSEMDEVLELADTIMVCHNGRISGFVDSVELATQEDILRIAFE